MDATPEMRRTPREPVKPDTVSPALFAHFVLRTSNFEAMRTWYKTVLNARVVHDNGTLCFMTYDDEHHRLALIHVPGKMAPGISPADASRQMLVRAARTTVDHGYRYFAVVSGTHPSPGALDIRMLAGKSGASYDAYALLER